VLADATYGQGEPDVVAAAFGEMPVPDSTNEPDEDEDEDEPTERSRASMELGRPSSEGYLSRDQIERVVRRHARGIRYCYERELQDDADLEGRIVVNWTINLDGHVSRRSIESNDMGTRDVENCLLREVGRMRFAEPDGGLVLVRYPFSFRLPSD